METKNDLVSRKQLSGRRTDAKARAERPEQMRRKVRMAMQRLRARRRRERWCNPELLNYLFSEAERVPAQPVRPRKFW